MNNNLKSKEISDDELKNISSGAGPSKGAPSYCIQFRTRDQCLENNGCAWKFSILSMSSSCVPE